MRLAIEGANTLALLHTNRIVRELIPWPIGMVIGAFSGMSTLVHILSYLTLYMLVHVP